MPVPPFRFFFLFFFRFFFRFFFFFDFVVVLGEAPVGAAGPPVDGVELGSGMQTTRVSPTAAASSALKRLRVVGTCPPVGCPSTSWASGFGA